MLAAGVMLMAMFGELMLTPILMYSTRLVTMWDLIQTRMDPAVVRTLSDREFRSGLAEIAKHGIVLDAEYFADVERSAAAMLAREVEALTRIIGGRAGSRPASSSAIRTRRARCASP